MKEVNIRTYILFNGCLCSIRIDVYVAKVELEFTTRPPSSTSFISGFIRVFAENYDFICGSCGINIGHSFVRVWMDARMDCAATVWCIYTWENRTNWRPPERLLAYWYGFCSTKCSRWKLCFIFGILKIFLSGPWPMCIFK